MFKAATVKSAEKFSKNAGRRLGEALLAKLNHPPDACWLFCSSRSGLQELLKGVADVVKTGNLIGCTTGGEISDLGISTGSAVLGGIVTDKIDFHIASAVNLKQDSEEAGKNLARQLPGNVSHVQLFSDGLTGNGCAILRGINSVFKGQTPIVGGTAGDDGKFQRTWQFAGDKLLSDAVVAIGFSGDFRIGTGAKSGWAPIGVAKKVTRASGNTLYELNGESALKVYERFLGKHAAKLPAIGVEYPLGLTESNRDRWSDGGEYDSFLLRATMSVDRRQGSITFAGEIPEGARVHLTCGDSASILSAVEKAAREAISDLGGGLPNVVFCYSCYARKIVLGRRITEETDIVRQSIGKDTPLMGFYTYGEFCGVSSDSACYLHNETISLGVISV